MPIQTLKAGSCYWYWRIFRFVYWDGKRKKWMPLFHVDVKNINVIIMVGIRHYLNSSYYILIIYSRTCINIHMMLYIFVILLMHNISCGYSFLNHLLERKKWKPSTLRHSPLFASSTSSTSSPTNDLVVPQGILGPPEPLKSLKVGQYVNAFRQSYPLIRFRLNSQ